MARNNRVIHIGDYLLFHPALSSTCTYTDALEDFNKDADV